MNYQNPMLTFCRPKLLQILSPCVPSPPPPPCWQGGGEGQQKQGVGGADNTHEERIWIPELINPPPRPDQPPSQTRPRRRPQQRSRSAIHQAQIAL
jgi:hypothetical protein